MNSVYLPLKDNYACCIVLKVGCRQLTNADYPGQPDRQTEQDVTDVSTAMTRLGVAETQ